MTEHARRGRKNLRETLHADGGRRVHAAIAVDRKTVGPLTFGVELRIEHDGALIESRLSRYGEAPLLLIADQVKANLIEQGWFGTPNRT